MATTTARKTAATPAAKTSTEQPAAPETTPAATVTTGAESTPDKVEDKAGSPEEDAADNGLFAKLAIGAKQVDEMPKADRASGGRRNPFVDLVLTSHQTGKPFELKPMDTNEKEVARVTNALRRAAGANGLGVTVVPTVVDGKTVITFQGRAKNAR